MKRNPKEISILSVVIFVIMLLFNPVVSQAGARQGLQLWFNILIPAIFPAMFISKLILNMNIDEKINKIFFPIFKHFFPTNNHSMFPIMFSILAGLPTNASIISDIYDSGRLNEFQAKYIILLTSNPGITFIINFVAHFTLDDILPLYIIIPVVYLSSYISSAIYYLKNIQCFFTTNFISNTRIVKHKQLTEIMFDSIHTITLIGIYIMFFSILQNNITSFISNEYINCILSSILEITTGCNTIHTLNNITLKCIISVCCITFGGLSAIFQISIVTKHIQVTTLLLKQKMLSTLIALSIMIALFKFY